MLQKCKILLVFVALGSAAPSLFGFYCNGPIISCDKDSQPIEKIGKFLREEEKDLIFEKCLEYKKCTVLTYSCITRPYEKKVCDQEIRLSKDSVASFVESLREVPLDAE